jgi:hypothetical protein
MKRAFLRLQRRGWVGPALLLALTLSAGCSGINASKSVSPLDFLLPGLIKNDAPAPIIPDATNTLAFLDTGIPVSAIH